MAKRYKKPIAFWSKLTAAQQAALTGAVCVTFYFAVALGSAETIKKTAMFASVAALASVALRFRTLRERVSLPLLALTLYALMDGLSTLYADAGKFALAEFLKVLIAFCLALALLAAAPGEKEKPGRWIATVLAGSAAISGLVSIDLLSTHLLSGAVLWIFDLFGLHDPGVTGLEPGVRMTSLYGNPNTFAGSMGLGLLLSLSLAGFAEERRERRLDLVMLYACSLAFILAFSMGASGAIAVAFLAYLALEQRERRGRLLVLMLETLLLIVPAAAIISVTSFQKWDGVDPVPLLCLAAGAALLCVVDHFIGQRLSEKLEGRGKLVAALTGGLFAFLLVFVAAAWNLTGAAALQPGGSLRRSAYPDPGTYTLSIESDGPLAVRIQSQNRQETMMHTSTPLYSGDAADATFAVPEDSLVVYFNFSAPEGATVVSAAYVGEAGAGKIPLDYKLLPGFIANRLQGLLANENAIQRLVFFEDGMKLFRKSPVVGLGMGAYENSIKSVQSFFYETKYAHNHYIQALVDTGAVGLVLFVALLIISALAVWRGRKKHFLAPALGACLTFMAGHAATELVFSSYIYLPVAFGVFALIGLCCGDAIQRPRLSRDTRSAALSFASGFIAIFAVLLGMNMRAVHMVTTEADMPSLVRAAKIDLFEWADYMLTYVYNASDSQEGSVTRRQADAYAKRLGAIDSNATPLYLTEYYLATDRTALGMEAAEDYAAMMASDEAAWGQIFGLLEFYEGRTEDPEAYRQGVLRLADFLERWNAENLGEVSLDEDALALVARMRAP